MISINAHPGAWFADPHSYKSVRNPQTGGLHLLASAAKDLLANPQAQGLQSVTINQEPPVRGQKPVCVTLASPTRIREPNGIAVSPRITNPGKRIGRPPKTINAAK